MFLLQVGHWLGLPPEFTARLDSVASAQCLLESILPHVVNSDDSSSRLVFASLRAVAFRAPFYWSMTDLARVSRMFAGDFLADCLGIPAGNDARLRVAVEDHNPRTSLPSELKFVECSNPQLALVLPPAPPAAAKFLVLLVSAAARCVRLVCDVFSPAETFRLPVSFRIMPHIVRYACVRRWLAPKLHDRVTRMVDYRLGLCEQRRE